MNAFTPPPAYFVLHEGVEQGPFTLEMIASMIAEGVYSAPLQVREYRSDCYQILEIAPDPPAEPGAAQAKARARKKDSQTSPVRMIGVGVAIGVILIILLATIFGITKPKSPPEAQSEDYSEELAHLAATRRAWTDGDAVAREALDREALRRQIRNHSGDKTPPSLDQVEATAPTFSLRDASGQVYYISTSDFNRLSPIKDCLDQDGAVIAQENKRMIDAFDLLEMERNSLNNSDQRAVDAFNRMVDKLNQQNAKLQDKIKFFNIRVDEFNSELKRVATFPTR
ncbi:DUF4339 domain-containing protein [Haloferula sp. BvORR071]|uniref:DUF4339 domain-containing protein n=1 Tax=Haloferula sp. BvORR071 TaxID=1396141 RepID=UPI0005518825|nr:DUF4339 domain-containing protein [Haloferula sp. BvORR071]